MRLGRPLAGILIEPQPRGPGARWPPFQPPTGGAEPLQPPWYGPDRSLHDVAACRRSALRGPIAWPDVGNLLWHVTRQTARAEKGRSGLRVEFRATPSAGGLHPFSLVCLNADDHLTKLYDAAAHCFRPILGDKLLLQQVNAQAVKAVIGNNRGCTVRFIADTALADAAYVNAETLLLRDAGALLAVMSLFAEQLGLAACPLGFLGQEIVEPLGFPPDRFLSIGGVQISR